MTPAEILAAVLQLAALFPTLEPAFVQAVKDFSALFANNTPPTQADIDALIERVKTQSSQIQQIAEQDAASGTTAAPVPTEPPPASVADANAADSKN